MFSVDTLYVQIFADRFVATNVDSGQIRDLPRDPQSVSPRMLIGDFTVAQHQLQGLVKAVRRGLRAPQLLVHPMERIDGGITQVEHRVFLELGLGSGASRVAVHAGPILSGDGVRLALRHLLR
jgi:hypothetical protein